MHPVAERLRKHLVEEIEKARKTYMIWSPDSECGKYHKLLVQTLCKGLDYFDKEFQEE
jgi:hypothetical protein